MRVKYELCHNTTMLSEHFPQTVVNQIMRQNKQNKVWRENDTPEVVSRHLEEEYRELFYEIDTHPDIAFLVAGEIGDILYLAIKLEDLAGGLNRWQWEMVNDALEICELTGLEPVHCVLMKVMRNDLKYVAVIQNNGFNFQEARTLSKTMWKNGFGGDEWFSSLWLDYGEVVNHDTPLEAVTR